MTETPAPDLRALRELAEVATPGPWWRSGTSVETEHDCSPSHGCWPVADTWSGTKPDGTKQDNAIIKADAAFIAAANPRAVLALIERVEAAEAAVERVRALVDEWRSAAQGARNLRDRASEFADVYAHDTAAANYGYHASRLHAALGAD